LGGLGLAILVGVHCQSARARITGQSCHFRTGR
jgi:hypothetical protein